MLQKIAPVIFFDLDDTLISFDGMVELALEKCVNDFYEKYSPGITKDEFIKARRKAGNWYWADSDRSKAGRENMRQARRDVFQLTCTELNITDTRISDELADNYTAYHDELICLFPNTISALERLSSHGVRMGIITNGASDGQRKKLKRFDLERFFEAVFIDQEVGYSKPDPRIFCHALDLMGVSAKNAWMVGDNLTWDVAGAQAAEIYAIWNDYEKVGLPAFSDIKPDKIITEISELLN